MNKTVKAILYGVGSFVGVFLIIVVIRCLIRGVAFGDELKDWTNWAVAAGSGIASALTSLSNDKKKEAAEKEEKK